MGRPGGPGPLDPIFDVDTVYGQFAFDNTPGTPRLPVTINQAAGQDDPTAASPILFTVVFSRAVAGFVTGDVTITGTAGASVGVVTEVAPFDGTTYQVAVSDMAGEGTVTATILAGVCNAVDDGMQNGHSTSTDNTVTYAVAFVEEFCDPFPTPGTLVWDAHYSRSDWPLFGNLGGGSFTVSGGVASFGGLNPAKEVQRNATSNRNAFAFATNQTNYGTGVDRALRLIINAGRDGTGAGTGASSYYWGAMGRGSSAGYVAIGKYCNGADNTIATAAVEVAVGEVFRVRHDGAGNLAIDVDGVEVLAAFDTIGSQGQSLGVAGTSVFLRGLGVGIAGSVSTTSGGFTVAIGGFCSGIWGNGLTPEPVVPESPWFTADHVDIDTIASGLWIKDPGGGGLTQSVEGAFWFITSSLNTDHAELADESLLSADQFVEASLSQASQVVGYQVYLRSASSASGYYFTIHRVADFPSDHFFWRIGIVGGAVLATGAEFFTGGIVPAGRMRAEVEGSTLRAYWNGVLQVSASDGSISGANTVRLRPLGNSGQGIPKFQDIIVGNL